MALGQEQLNYLFFAQSYQLNLIIYFGLQKQMILSTAVLRPFLLL